MRLLWVLRVYGSISVQDTCLSGRPGYAMRSKPLLQSQEQKNTDAACNHRLEWQHVSVVSVRDGKLSFTFSIKRTLRMQSWSMQFGLDREWTTVDGKVHIGVSSHAGQLTP